MKHRALHTAGRGVLMFVLSGAFGSVGAQPLQRTESLCGPTGGASGTSWISLPSEGVITTAEQLCLAVTPTPVSVAQVFPDGTGRYTYDCVANTCTSTGTVPEPSCTTSTCFCVDTGEGVEIKASATSTLDVYGCDSFVTINVPIVGGAGGGSIVSVPFNTFLVTANDLGVYFGLPSSGLMRGAVLSMECSSGVGLACSLGTAQCNALTLTPGKAYMLRSPTTAVYSALNPVTCQPPNPAAAACPIDGLAVTPSGASNTLTWNPPGMGCTLPLDYAVARFDLDCLVHYCKACPSCVTLGQTSATTFTDTPPIGNWGYLVSVVGGTWNSTSTTQCVDRDIMFSLGCP